MNVKSEEGATSLLLQTLEQRINAIAALGSVIQPKTQVRYALAPEHTESPLQLPCLPLQERQSGFRLLECAHGDSRMGEIVGYDHIGDRNDTAFLRALAQDRGNNLPYNRAEHR